MQGISKGQRGRRTGQQRTLGKEQEAAVQKTIQDRTPDQMKMPFALLDPSGGTGVDQASARHKNANPDGRGISYAVGFYATEANPQGI